MSLRTICWLSGWASDLRSWQAETAQYWPQREHYFVSYPDLLAHSDNLVNLPPVRTAEVLVAWSLGSLIALQNLSTLPHLHAVILLSPIFDFCGPGAWNPRVVQRMERKLSTDPETVLRDFASQLTPMAAADQQRWVDNALQYGTELLQSGLAYLRTQQAHLNTPAAIPIFILTGAQDRIVTPETATRGAQQLNLPLEIIPAAGHWPMEPAFLQAVAHIEKQIC